MNRYTWLFALTFGAFAQLFGQEPLYINVDPTCMDRFEYHINGQTKGIEYITYRVRQSAQDFVFLEVGSEGTTNQLSAPENAKDCRKVVFSPAYVDKINAAEVQLFIVRKADIGYNISPVNLASFYANNANTLKSRAYGLDFFCNYGHADSKTNLSQSESAYELYYSGESPHGCYKQHHFRRSPKETCKPEVDIEYIPEIGVVREVTRVSQINDHESFLNLVRINDISFDTYLQNLCDGKKEGLHMPTSYAVETTDLSGLNNNEVVMDGQIFNTTSSEPAVYADASSSIPKEYAITPKTILTSKSVEPTFIEPKKGVISTPKVDKKVAPNGSHLVLAGETLYGISRKYGVTVTQLKSWNKLTTDIIKPNMLVKVAEPIATTKLAATKSTTEIKAKPASAAAVKSYDQPIAKFTAKGIEDMPIMKKGSLVEKSAVATTNFKRMTVHIVQEDETLENIANQYKQNIDNLLLINGLEKQDVLIPNQRIFVD